MLNKSQRVEAWSKRENSETSFIAGVVFQKLGEIRDVVSFVFHYHFIVGFVTEKITSVNRNKKCCKKQYQPFQF